MAKVDGGSSSIVVTSGSGLGALQQNANIGPQEDTTLIYAAVLAAVVSSGPVWGEMILRTDRLVYGLGEPGWIAADANYTSTEYIDWSGRFQLSEQGPNDIVALVRNDTGTTFLGTIVWRILRGA